MPDPVSVHSASNQLAELAYQNGHKTAFERYEKQVPHVALVCSAHAAIPVILDQAGLVIRIKEFAAPMPILSQQGVLSGWLPQDRLHN